MSMDIPVSPAGARQRSLFGTFMNRYGTPLTTVFFIVSGVTGIALFFHWGPGAFHPMHEWLSMVLLLPFILHLVKNWGSLMNYARKGRLYVPFLIAVLASAYFFLAPAGTKTGNKQVAFRIVGMVGKSPISQIAPVLGLAPEEAMHRLEHHHFTVGSDADSAETIATASGKDVNDVLAALVSNDRGGASHDHHGQH